MDDYIEELHKVLLSIFLDIKKFCMEHKLTYCMVYGSAIGAVRHSGFIPWDDDLDIAMSIEDVEKFSKLWDKYGNHDKYILKKIDRNSHINHMKVILRDSKFMVPGEPEGMDGAFVDIFPIYKVKKNKVKQMYVWNAVRLVYTRRYVAKNNGKAMLVLSWCMLKLVPKFIQEKLYNKACKYIVKYQDLDMKDCYMCSLQTVQGPLRYHDYDIFDNIKQVKFEGIDVNIPANNDDILKSIYGDYMQLPPENERQNKHEIVLRGN